VAAMVARAIEATSAQIFACRGVLEVNIMVYCFLIGLFLCWFGAVFTACAKHIQANCDELVQNV
jgi:hypothetical protein